MRKCGTRNSSPFQSADEQMNCGIDSAQHGKTAMGGPRQQKLAGSFFCSILPILQCLLLPAFRTAFLLPAIHSPVQSPSGRSAANSLLLLRRALDSRIRSACTVFSTAAGHLRSCCSHAFLVAALGDLIVDHDDETLVVPFLLSLFARFRLFSSHSEISRATVRSDTFLLLGIGRVDRGVVSFVSPMGSVLFW
ncbi:hypothetical protein BBOR36S_01751 [Brevibacillus borstelensis]|jgi:hypothetical protein